jgi:adenylate cyclase
LRPRLSARTAMRPVNLRRQSVALIAVVVAAMLLAAVLGLLDALELNAINLAFQLRGRQPPESPVVIVAVDDTSFANSGLQWPWPRTYFAQMVDRLKAGGARLIAFDIFFHEPEHVTSGRPCSCRSRSLAPSNIR